MRHMLIGPHHRDTSPLAIDSSNIKDIPTVLEVRARHLLVIDKSHPGFSRQQEGRHLLKRQTVPALLDHCTHIDYGADVCVAPSILLRRRVWRFRMVSAKTPDRGSVDSRIFFRTVHLEMPTRTRGYHVTQFQYLCVRQANYLRRMAPSTDLETGGQGLPWRIPGQHRRPAFHRHARGAPPMLDEVTLEPRRFDALFPDSFRRLAHDARPLPIK